MYYVVCLIIGFSAGVITMFFVDRNNVKKIQQINQNLTDTINRTKADAQSVKDTTKKL